MLSADRFREVMGSFAAGVTVVTTVDEGGEPRGITATAFSALSLDPPLCLVCIDKSSRTNHAVAACRRYAVNILTDRQAEVSRRFALRRDGKFDSVQWSTGEHGCPLLAGVLAWMECEVIDVLPGGDHDIFVGRLEKTLVNDGTPLVYFRGDYGSVRQVVA